MIAPIAGRPASDDQHLQSSTVDASSGEALATEPSTRKWSGRMDLNHRSPPSEEGGDDQAPLRPEWCELATRSGYDPLSPHGQCGSHTSSFTGRWNWCAFRNSNSDASRRQALDLVRLPFRQRHIGGPGWIRTNAGRFARPLKRRMPSAAWLLVRKVVQAGGVEPPATRLSAGALAVRTGLRIGASARERSSGLRRVGPALCH
jgi:hypothetical protein